MLAINSYAEPQPPITQVLRTQTASAEAESESEVRIVKAVPEKRLQDYTSENHWALGLTSIGSTGLLPALSYRPIPAWTLSITGGVLKSHRVDKTDPTIPHDYEVDSRASLVEMSLVREIAFASQDHLSWFLGAGAVQEKTSITYGFSNVRNNGFLNGTEVVNAGSSARDETQSFLSALVGIRYTEMMKGIFRSPLVITVAIELPTLGYRDN